MAQWVEKMVLRDLGVCLEVLRDHFPRSESDLKRVGTCDWEAMRSSRSVLESNPDEALKTVKCVSKVTPRVSTMRNAKTI